MKAVVTQKYVYHPYRMEPIVKRALGTRTFAYYRFSALETSAPLFLRAGKSMVMETAKFLTVGRNHFAKQCFSGQ